MKLGKYELPLGKRTLIMGIVNVTPDSFSDGGRFNNMEAALRHARQLIADGADIIDIGAESTRPYGNNKPIGDEEEQRRLLPILECLLSELAVPISVDTYHAATAEASLALGAHIINDVWGLQSDAEMAKVIAKYNATVVVMHNQAHEGYDDLMRDINAFLHRSIAIAAQAGIGPQHIIVDPGVGFAKSREDDIVCIRRLRELEELSCPILLGTSRKSFIGKTLDLPADERLEGTAATVAIGIANGADIVRVHDVKQIARVARMTDALVRDV